MAVADGAPAGRGRSRGGQRSVADETSETTALIGPDDLGDDTGVIYVIGEVGLSTPVKIGLAVSQRHARRRLLTFATGNFRPVEMLAVIPKQHARWIEHQLHCALAPWKVPNPNSTEWFDVRHLVTDGWEAFVARALAGKLDGAGPLPELSGSPGHQLDHVHGWPRHLRAVCTCGWGSGERSVYAALRKYRQHAGVQEQDVKQSRTRSRPSTG